LDKSNIFRPCSFPSISKNPCFYKHLPCFHYLQVPNLLVNKSCLVVDSWLDD
jgi:hypothetical protein